MKILYDHQMFSRQTYGGISRYFCGLMDQFSQSPDVRFTLALRATVNENLSRRPYLNKYWSGRSPFLSTVVNTLPRIQKVFHVNLMKRLPFNAWESVRMVRQQDFDVFHPTYYNPYFFRYLQKKPYVVTVHDMIHERFPEFFPHDPAVQWKKKVIEHADAVIAISENTRNDIRTILDIEPERIFTVYHANPLESSQPHSGAPVKQPHLPEPKKPYLLFVGTRAGYKNFEFFISSAARLIKERGLHICCAGGGSFTPPEMKLLKEHGIESSVSTVAANDLFMPWLYANAIAFVFPSLYEGFGFPVLEAFSCGCPVIAAGTGSLPEIGGDAAIYFDPRERDSLIRAIQEIIDNEKQRDDCISKGFIRVKEFSWEKTAQETKRVYENVL